MNPAAFNCELGASGKSYMALASYGEGCLLTSLMAEQLQPRFLDYTTARTVAEQFGTPVYVYDMATLKHNAAAVLDFPNAFRLTARYAMKASPNAAILKLSTRPDCTLMPVPDTKRAVQSRRLRAIQDQLSTQELPQILPSYMLWESRSMPAR